MKENLEGKLGPFQALAHVGLSVATFIGMIFAARYVNLMFDKIHATKREELPPGLDKPVKGK